MSHQTIKSADTTRSWRAMRMVFCWLVSIVLGAGSCGAYYFDRNVVVANAHENVVKVNEKLKHTADLQSVPLNSSAPAWPNDRPLGAPPPAAAALPDFIPDDHPLTPDEILKSVEPYETRSWKTIQAEAATPPSLIVFQSLGLGILAGVGGWIGAWLLIVAIAFVWWFILDRIREIARAIKGQH